MTQQVLSDRIPTRQLVCLALRSPGVAAADVKDVRYVLIAKVDDDSLSDRVASFHADEVSLRRAIETVPPGWWPDCVIDLEAPVDGAVRDAAVGDGSLGPAYPFDEDHVIFA